MHHLVVVLRLVVGRLGGAPAPCQRGRQGFLSHAQSIRKQRSLARVKIYTRKSAQGTILGHNLTSTTSTLGQGDILLGTYGRNYKIVDFTFYPGSLGNYAGNERGIPTVTLELETTNPEKLAEYWTQFSPGLEQAVKYPFVNPSAPRTKGASLFLESYGRKTAQFNDTKSGEESPKSLK